MAVPTKIEWDCGRDAYGRAVVLRYERGTGGQHSGFTVHRHEKDQRDEAEKVGLLTLDNLEAMVAAAKAMPRG